MDGFECVTRLREIERLQRKQRETDTHNSINTGAVDSPRQMIIACSANNDNNTIDAAYKAGVDAFEFKPLTVNAFETVYVRLKNNQ